MKTLTAEAFQRAVAFLHESGRPLEVALYRHEFCGEPENRVLGALASYQNPDGGFGHCLEPDFRLVESSVMATTVAYQTLRRIGAVSAFPTAVQWLESQWTPAGLDSLPLSINEVPRAPWWGYREGAAADGLTNPGPEFALILHESESPLAEPVVSAVRTALLDLPEWEMHVLLGADVLCRVTGDAELADRVRAEAHRLVLTQPSDWAGYGLRPLTLIDHPAHPLASDFGDALEAELDVLIGEQGPDGAWSPSWSWFGQFDDVWPVAHKEWQSVLTLGALRKLRAFGRIEAG